MEEHSLTHEELENLPPLAVKTITSLIRGEHALIAGVLPFIGLLFLIPLVRGYLLKRRYPVLAKDGPYDRLLAAHWAAVRELLACAGYVRDDEKGIDARGIEFLKEAIKNAKQPPLKLPDGFWDTMQIIHGYRSAMVSYWVGLFLFPALVMIAFALVLLLCWEMGHAR